MLTKMRPKTIGGVLPARVLPAGISDLRVVGEMMESRGIKVLRQRSPHVPWAGGNFLSPLTDYLRFAERANTLMQVSKVRYMTTIADSNPVVWNLLSTGQKNALMHASKFNGDQQRSTCYAVYMGIGLGNTQIIDALLTDAEAISSAYDRSKTIFQCFNGCESEAWGEWDAYDVNERNFANSIGIGGQKGDLEIKKNYEDFRESVRRIVRTDDYEPYGIHCYNTTDELVWATVYPKQSNPRSVFVTEINSTNANSQTSMVRGAMNRIISTYPNSRVFIIHELLSHRFYSKFLDGTNMELFDVTKLPQWSAQTYEFMLFKSNFWDKLTVPE